MLQNYSIRVKLPAIVATACLGLVILSWVIIVSQTSQMAKQAINDKGQSTLNQLTEVIRAPLFSNDIISIQFALRTATEDSTIFSASLYDIENNLIAKSSQTHPKPEVMKSFRNIIEINDTLAGTLVVNVKSESIKSLYSKIFYLWIVAWLVFTLSCVYACYYFASKLTRRLMFLTNRLPGSNEPMMDELVGLEKKIQPLLLNSRHSEDSNQNGYYCSVISGHIKNRVNLEKQLNQENIELLFENIDLCIQRTLELYSAQRLEGDSGTICFYIRSSQSSKQHILVCLMAIYSLQQLLVRLSETLGINLEITWTLCSDNISALPIFANHESIYKLKEKAKSISQTVKPGAIALSINEFSIDQLSTIARFRAFEKDCYIFEGFPEQRQLLLEKQIMYLVSVCL